MSQVNLTSVTLFKKIICTNIDLIEDYLDSFMPLLLSDDKLDELNKEKLILQVERIHTLTLLSAYDAFKITKFRKQVIRAMKKVLNSKSRVIRKFARNCLNEWEMI